MFQLKENQLLSSIFSNSKIASNRLNKPFEADVEILDVPFNKGEEGSKLAFTVDVISEEIEEGLYTDPFLIGWMSVVVSLSDLAAAGAEPLGLLSIFNVDKKLPKPFLSAIYEGIQTAANEFNTPILGGDTNFTNETQIGSVGIGLLDSSHFLTRKGMKEGDILFATGKLGAGNAFAFEKLFATSDSPKISFQPRPKLQESEVFKKYASASIDTSDGFFPALCQLLEVNQLGVEISCNWDNVLNEQAVELYKAAGIPAWFFLAGPHGEFEILFSLPQKHLEAFCKEAEAINWQPIEVGVISDSSGKCTYLGKEIPTFEMANAFFESGQSPTQYFHHLLNLQTKIQL